MAAIMDIVRQRGGGAPHPELGAAAAHQAGHQPADQVEHLRDREGVPRPRPVHPGADRHLRQFQDVGGGPVGNITLIVVGNFSM